MRKSVDVSLVIACYNEGPTLAKSLKKIQEVLEGTKYTWEIICIDDKSRDKTATRIQKFVDGKKNFRAYFNKKNLGRGKTVNLGVKLAKGRIVGYIDVDLEVSAVYIPQFIREVEKGADIATGTRVYKVMLSNLLRTLATKIYITLSQNILKHKIKDTEAGYKFFKRSTILPIIKKTKDHHWFFDTEILIRSLDKGLKIKEIPVLHMKRDDKKSTMRLLSDTIAYLKAMHKFKTNR